MGLKRTGCILAAMFPLLYQVRGTGDHPVEDDPFLAETRYRDDVTLRQVLSHTSGLSNLGVGVWIRVTREGTLVGRGRKA